VYTYGIFRTLCQIISFNCDAGVVSHAHKYVRVIYDVAINENQTINKGVTIVLFLSQSINIIFEFQITED